MKKRIFMLALSLMLSPLIGETVKNQGTTKHKKLTKMNPSLPFALKQMIGKGIMGAVTSAFGIFSIAGIVNSLKVFRESFHFDLNALTDVVEQKESRVADLLSKNPAELKEFVNYLGKGGLKQIPAVDTLLTQESKTFQELMNNTNITDIVFEKNYDPETQLFIDKVGETNMASIKEYLVNSMKQNLFQRGILGTVFCSAFLALTTKIAYEYFFKEKNGQEKKEIEPAI